MDSASNTTAGADGCRCIDVSETLASLVERSCTTSDGEDGVLLTVTGPCVDYTFGSSSCLPHDMYVYPPCQPTGPEDVVPAYCDRPWCYVDALSCMGASSERVFRSTHFPHGSAAELFVSYSTCGSSEDAWLQSPEYNEIEKKALRAIVPALHSVPYIYKRNSDGKITEEPGIEYYNNSVPFEGVHINFVRELEKISDGDLEVDFVHGSRASMDLYPGVPGTAAVQDVADGLADIAVGPFWITAPRLKMTPFTLPIQYDRTVLVIRNPGARRSPIQETQKVLDPFTNAVWVLLLGIIAVTALLSVWFSGKRSPHPFVYARLAVDEFLQNGISFCSAGIEQDRSASLPRKILMFGFGFFILIVVSAYVANLAAFLTRSGFPITSIDDVIASGMKICAHPVLKQDLEAAHPTARFEFNKNGKEFYGIVDDYLAKKCHVMAMGMMDTLDDLDLMDIFCKHDLVYTESLVIENEVGFPIRPNLASLFSYWVYEGESNHDVNLPKLREQYITNRERKLKCNVLLSEQGGEADEFAKIDVLMLFFPIMWFVGAAVVAVILHIYYGWARKRVNESEGNFSKSTTVGALMGRESSLKSFMNPHHFTTRDTFNDNDENHEEEEVNDVQLAPTGDTAATIATGSIALDDTVQVDGFPEHKKGCFHENKKVRFHENKGLFSFDPSSEEIVGTNRFSDSGDVAGLFRLEKKMDEFIHCYQRVKMQIEKS